MAGFRTNTATRQEACLHDLIAADFDLVLQVRMGRHWVTLPRGEDAAVKQSYRRAAVVVVSGAVMVSWSSEKERVTSGPLPVGSAGR